MLLACSALLHSTAMSLDMVEEIGNFPKLNFVPGTQIFFSMISGVPTLLAVSKQFDRRVLGAARAIDTLLSLAIGAMLYLQIISLLTLNGSNSPADALLILRLFDGIDLFLAVAATIRWVGADQPQVRSFFRIASIFLWIDALFPAIHNRLLRQHDYIWLDLFISAPYVVLLVLALTVRPSPVRPLSPAMVRSVRIGSPLFLSLALLFLAVIVTQTHFYIGLAAALLSVAGYGALNILAQSRGLEAEEELRAAKELLEELAGIDGLTGIPNRRTFDSNLKQACMNARRNLVPVSLLMIDVDHFKQLNDAKGHPVGDSYLIQIAGALQRALPRETDSVARYGGEEFAAILPATDRAGAAEVAQKIHRGIAALRLSHPFSPGGFVSISIGCSTLESRQSPASLIHAADRALYKAKQSGRARTEFFPIDRGAV